jgi:hypothetical protein
VFRMDSVSPLPPVPPHSAPRIGVWVLCTPCPPHMSPDLGSEPALIPPWVHHHHWLATQIHCTEYQRELVQGTAQHVHLQVRPLGSEGRVSSSRHHHADLSIHTTHPSASKQPAKAAQFWAEDGQDQARAATVWWRHTAPPVGGVDGCIIATRSAVWTPTGLPCTDAARTATMRRASRGDTDDAPTEASPLCSSWDERAV